MALAGLFMAMGLTPSGVSAQLEVDQLDVTLRPAAGISSALFNVRNASGQARTVQITSADWDRSVNGENRFTQAGTVAGSCHPHVEIFPMTLQLEPGETQSVRVTYTGAPKDTMCWTAVSVTPTPTPQTGTGSQLVVQVVHMVKVYVEPAVARQDVAIAELDIERRAQSNGTARDEVVVQVVNQGNVQSRVTGSVEFRTVEDRLVQRSRLNDVYLLPGAQQRSQATLPDLPPGRYIVLVILDYGGPELVAGQIDLVIGS